MIDSSYETSGPGNTSPEFPWPPREHDSVFEALGTTWKDSVFHPASFFARMPREFDFGWVLGYYLIIGVANAAITLFWEMVLGPGLLTRMLQTEGGVAAGSPLLDFLLSPLMLIAGLFIGAGLVHMFLLLFRSGQNGFQTTVRVFAFSVGPQLFAIVPYIGSFIAGVWVLVLTAIGLREAHQTTMGKVIAAILVPVVLLTASLVLLFIASLLLDPGMLSR